MGRGWVSGLYCRYLEGKVSQSSLGFGDKVWHDSISFVFWIFCQSWPLESPFFLASLPSFQSQVQVQLSLSKPAAGYLASLPLLWVGASLKSHLTICTGTLGSLVILGKLISFLSPSRPPHILHLLSAGSTPGGLISTVFPPSWARSGSSCLHSPRSEVWISPSPFMSPLLGMYNLHWWPQASHSLWDPHPHPWAAQRAWPSGTLPAYLAGSPCDLPGGRLQSVFLTSLTHTGPDSLLVSSSEAIPRSFWEKGRSVCSSDDTCSECLAISPRSEQRLGVSVLASLLPTQHNQHTGTLRQASVPGQCVLGLRKMGSHRGAVWVTWGCTAKNMSCHTRSFIWGCQAVTLFSGVDSVIDQCFLFA